MRRKPSRAAAPEAAGGEAVAEISEAELDEPVVEGVKEGGKELIGNAGKRRTAGPGAGGGARRGAR